MTLPKLLTYELSEETILSLMGRMQLIVSFFKQHSQYHALLPFLYTYYLVTKMVAEKNIERYDYYRRPKKLEEVDLHFAHLYFQPLRTYVDCGEKPRPWHTYFTYCEQENGVPFVQMLLGINAHINADLSLSLVETDYREKQDFKQINAVLQEVIPAVLNFLAQDEHDVFGLGGLVFQRRVREEFKRIIVSWRSQAWRNAEKLRSDPKAEQELHMQTEELGGQLCNIFNSSMYLRTPQTTLRRVRELQVSV